VQDFHLGRVDVGAQALDFGLENQPNCWAMTPLIDH